MSPAEEERVMAKLNDAERDIRQATDRVSSTVADLIKALRDAAAERNALRFALRKALDELPPYNAVYLELRRLVE